jgi:hypothetical protein
MIDNQEQTDRLLAKLHRALPMPTRVTPELAATLRTQNPGTEISATCSITSLHYAGDEGGIVCGLDLAAGPDKVVYTSITHLRFDPRLPLAREITAYQKHRVKRLRHQPAGSP